MLTFFTENDLISSNQSVYKPEGSIINQVLSIAHEIQKSLDCGWDVKGVFFDNSKAFDKFQANGVVLKLKKNGISGNLRMILQECLYERKEKVMLNGQIFSWANVTVEVPLVQFLVQCFFSSSLFEPTSPFI